MADGISTVLLVMITVCFCQVGIGQDLSSSQARLISTAPQASAVAWYEDFDAGWQAAKESRRPMVIFISSKRCYYCDAMKQSTWVDRGVLDKIKQKFVAIRLTPERNSKVLERIDVPAYPTTLVGHPDGHILGHRVGFQPASAMQSFLNKMQQSIH